MKTFKNFVWTLPIVMIVVSLFAISLFESCAGNSHTQGNPEMTMKAVEQNINGLWTLCWITLLLSVTVASVSYYLYKDIKDELKNRFGVNV